MTHWVRLWHDMPTDPKFRTIAKASGQPLAVVVAVFCFLLTDASNAPERGRTLANDEDIGSALDLDPQQVSAIRSAMQGRVLDGDRLTGWEKRQPKKEDNSANRSKAWREAQKDSNDIERSRTQSNATERPDKIQIQIREDIDAAPKRSRQGYSKLPEDWTLPDGWRESAVESRQRHRLPSIDLTLEAERFKLHWLDKGEMKKNWRATWLKWVVSPYIKADKPGKGEPISGPPMAMLPGSNTSMATAESHAKRIRERKFGTNLIPDHEVRCLIAAKMITADEARACGFNIARETSEAA